MALSKGDKAAIVAPRIVGEVIAVRFDPETGEKLLLLAWGDNERWFTESELEAA